MSSADIPKARGQGDAPEAGSDRAAVAAAMHAIIVLCDCALAAEGMLQAAPLLSSAAIVAQAALQGPGSVDAAAESALVSVLTLCGTSSNSGVGGNGVGQPQVAVTVKALCSAHLAVDS